MKEPMYIRQAQTENLLGEKIQLYYFTREGEEARGYAIGIDMYTLLTDQRTVKESKIIENVFENKEDAQRFTDMLCSGCVTPVTLEDIVSDTVGEKVF